MLLFPENLDINKRWAAGVPHHPSSKAFYSLIEAIDYRFGGDSLSLKSGGDGDNGESLMYALDIIFEAADDDQIEALQKLLGV